MNRRQRLMIAILTIGAAALVVPGFSSAAFTSQTTGTGTVSAAADWTPPTVSVVDPGAAVKGTTSIVVNASDAESGIQGVELQVQPTAGGAWATICSTTTSPYSCAWDTTARADGSYLLRAIATDRAGYSTTSATVRTTVANSLTVSIAALPDFVRGNVAVQATVSNAGGLNPVARIEYAPAGSSTWTTICANLSSPYSCTAATAGIPNGSYDVRAVAVVGNATYASAPVRTFVDNTAPTVTMTDPGSPLTGTKTFTATASDAQSGVDAVAIQYATGNDWTTLCTVKTAPYSCNSDTSALPNGAYSFRAVATDKAGNTTTSAVIANRTVTNIVSTVTLADPGAYLRGTVALNATTTTNGTISTVAIQRAPAGSSTWTTICTDATSPYSCSWNTATQQTPDGVYDLRAVLTDSTGKTTTSAVVAARIVDNTRPAGFDVQADNGGGQVGRIDAGDTITFTYSEQIDLNTILSGWDGQTVSSSATLDVGLFGSSATLNLDQPGRPKLGSVNMNAFGGILPISNRFETSITASTNTATGTPRTVITVQIVSGTSTRTSSSAVNMVWSLPTGIADLAGNTISGGSFTETGGLDVDF